MKKTLSLLLISATLITACSKSGSNNNPKPSTPTVLLTKVIDNTTGDPNIGQPLYEFTYNGKQLTKAVIYHYAGSDVETDLFSYDSNGHLTGSIISHTQSNTQDEASSTVTYDGDNVGEIKFYKANNVLDQDITVIYQNGKLASWFNPNEVKLTYTYDGNGNNTKNVATEYQNGTPDGEVDAVTNSTFDSKSNLSASLPLWIYFRVYIEDQCLTYTPGANNPVASNDGGSFTYSYQYASNGYPSAISWTDSYPQSYTYEYTQVN